MARSFTNAAEDNVLNWMFGGSGAYTPHPSNLTLCLALTVPGDAGSITQPGGLGYADQAIAFGASASGVITNTGTITFPVATGRWGRLLGWRIRDTVAAVNLATGFMGTLAGVVEAFDGSTDTITQGFSPLVNGERVFFTYADPDGNFVGTLPLGLSSIEDIGSPEYYVVNASGSVFQVSLTLGGSPVSFGTSFFPGCVQVWRSQIRTVDAGDQIVFAAGSVSISLK